MNLDSAMGHVGRVLNATLFKISGQSVSAATLLTFVVVLLATVWISRLARAGLRRAFAARGVRENTTAAMARLIHYVLLIIGGSIALQTVGVNLAALFAAGAVFAVAIGFAMQTIAQNFVSGVILLVEQSIKPGDVVAVEGQIVRVLAMRIRSTLVQTRDGEDLVVPNSVLVQSTVKNYTLKDSLHRIRASVGVVYGADMDAVRSALHRAASNMPWRVKEREPQILLIEFGDNAVIWEASVWVSDPWLARIYLSELNGAIWDEFKHENIVIAFPQLDLHLDEPIAESLRKLANNTTRA